MYHSRTFKFSIYLTVFAGILSIVSAEETVFYLLLFLIAAVLSWFLVDKNELSFLPERPAIFLVSQCLLFAAIDYRWISGGFWFALEHFLVLVLIVKLFQRKTQWVLFQIYGLSFLLILNSAGLTDNVSFLVVLLYYLVITTFSLSLFLIKCERHRHHQQPGRFSGSSDSLDMDLFLSRQYFHFTLGLAAAILLGTVSLFVLMPRFDIKAIPGGAGGGAAANADGNGAAMPDIPIGPVPGGLPPADSRSNFATGIDFSSMGDAIQRDPTVVALVKLSRNGVSLQAEYPDPNFYFRGIQINMPGEPVDLAAQRTDVITDLRDSRRDGWIAFHAPSTENLIDCGFQLRAGATEGMLLFLDRPVMVKADAVNYYVDDLGYGWHSETADPRKPLQYEALSEMPSPDIQRLALLKAAHPSPVYTAIPSRHDAARLRQLAGQMAAGAGNALDIATAIETRLQRDYRYSTLNVTPPGESPVEAFLFRQKSGWCEHFASAMVYLLRSLDIPCRAVGGFRGGEWSAHSDTLQLRRSDAHAWVEVYFNGYGWVRFDPTPGEETTGAGTPPVPDPVETASPEAAASAADTAKKALEEKKPEDTRPWLERYVIGYDKESQRTFWRGLGGGIGGGIGSLFQWLAATLQRFMYFRAGGSWLTGAIFFLLSVAVVIGAVWVWRGARETRGLAAQGRHFGGTVRVARFYNETIKLLAPLGFVRGRAQTAAEFTRQVEHRLRQPLPAMRKIADYYSRARFGGAKLEYAELKEIKHLLTELKRQLRASRESMPD